MRAISIGVAAGALVGALLSLAVRQALLRRATVERPPQALAGLPLVGTPEQAAQARTLARQIVERMQAAEQGSGAWRPVYHPLRHHPAAVQSDDLPGDIRSLWRE